MAAFWGVRAASCGDAADAMLIASIVFGALATVCGAIIAGLVVAIARDPLRDVVFRPRLTLAVEVSERGPPAKTAPAVDLHVSNARGGAAERLDVHVHSHRLVSSPESAREGTWVNSSLPW